MTTLAVLAGGEGRRMGGPKDQLLVGGRPVLVVLMERLRWRGPTVLVAPHGGRVPRGHESFDVVAADAAPGQGPLRGLLTALDAARGEAVVVIPVDMPGVEREHAEWVERRLAERPESLGVMLKHAAKVEPFPCAFRAASREMIRRRLESGDLAMHRLSEETGVNAVESPPEWGESIWRNINQPGDLPDAWNRGG